MTKQNSFKYRVAGVLLDGNRVLIHKCLQDGYWSLPGGKIHLGETSSEALQREIYEEIGWRIQPGRLLWVSENIYRQTGVTIHEIAFYYWVEITEEISRLTVSDHFYGIETEKELFFQWWNIDDLNQLILYPVFLKEKLRHLPEVVEHLVFRE